jgi:hypothetical protein
VFPLLRPLVTGNQISLIPEIQGSPSHARRTAGIGSPALNLCSALYGPGNGHPGMVLRLPDHGEAELCRNATKGQEQRS